MKNSKKEKYVKASKLIAALEARQHNAVVVDAGELHPFLSAVYVVVDEETHVCTLDAVYSYHEDCAEYGVDPGRSEAKVLGVTFGRQILYMEDGEIEVDGLIDYDCDLTEEDVIAAADEGIEFVDYMEDDFPFLEDEVTDEQIAEKLEEEMLDKVIARGPNKKLYAYEARKDVPKGFKVMSEKAAIKALSKERPGISYRAW